MVDEAWIHLGARLSGRALIFLVAKGWEGALREPRRPDAEEGPGLSEREATLVARALRAGRSKLAGNPPGMLLVTAAMPDFPPGFFRLEHPPSCFWVTGSLVKTRARVAVVGSRRATRNGRRFARELARDLAASGIEVWSGLARGVDSSAHEGALEAGRTVAVLGSGLDVVYPEENRDLAARITSAGAVLSEFPPGAPPLRDHFPRRNRLLAAACDALAVIEAGPRSGALSTVNWALSLGMPVLVAPGDPITESCRGSNGLLRAGAEMLLGAGDVLRSLGWEEAAGRGSSGARAGARPGPADPILDLLAVEPLQVDQIASRWAGPGQLGAELVRLELEGRIESLPGGFYARRD